MRHRRPRSPALALAGSLALLVVGAARAKDPPDLAALRERGLRTVARLEAAPARWRATIDQAGGERLVVLVEQASARRRLVEVWVERDGRRRQALALRVLDGRWDVAEEEGVSGRYRPFEAPFAHPALYLALLEAEPRALPAPRPGAEPQASRAVGGVATVREPLAPEVRRRFEAGLAEARELLEQRPDARGDPVVERRVRRLMRIKDELETGALTRVEVETGLLVDRPLEPGLRVVFDELRLLDAVPPALADPGSGAPPVDLSGDPGPGPFPERLLLARSGLTYGSTALAPDAVLVDLASGAARRVPFRGAACVPLGFVGPQRDALVLGDDGAGRALAVVALRAGVARPLSPGLPRGGDLQAVAVSLDGRQVALLHAAGGAPARLWLVAVDTGQAVPRPAPPGLRGFAWAADGRHLVVELEGPSEPTLALWSQESGDLRPLGPGQAPVALPDGRTLLAADRDGRWWRVDATTGARRGLVGDDGLPGLVAPSPAPGGREAVFLAPRPDGVALVRVDLESGARRPALPEGSPLHGILGDVTGAAWR